MTRFEVSNGGYNCNNVVETHMTSFCEAYDLTNLIKQPTNHKNTNNPTYIDLILTNVPHTFTVLV